MTKEELIALSDLNREDNIKYISSEAQGIAITLDSDRYAPNFCKLERAYICGRRKSEEQIEQLEKENAELNNFIMQSKKDGISPINALIIKNLGNQLTKAKEIIKLLLHALKNEGSDYTFALENTHPALAEAEQFIKDSEVEK